MTRRALACALPFILLLGACATSGKSKAGPTEGPVARPGASDHATLIGSGSTLATAVIRQWSQQYHSVARGVTVQFREAESDAAVDDQLRSGAADFGVSELPDGPPASGGDAAVPSVATALVVAYNLPGVTALRLSPVTLSRIFDGSLSSWDDPGIAADNPGKALPVLRITPVTRSDPSSANLLFSRYLQAAAPALWTAGSGTTASWPARTGVVGPDSMTKALKQRPGAVGYTSAAEAAAAGLGIAMVKNSAGHFSSPTVGSIDAYLLSAEGTPDNLVLSVPFETAAADAYPLSTFTYLLVPRSSPTTEKDAALRHFLTWILSEGQRSVDRTGAAPVPLPLLVRTLEALQSDDLRPRR